ncbi:MAG: penicillin-binding protein 2 [Gammaproteobacteria bacterium]|nr:penicillin-binding protein 2 [Gammaproteobacteria bacterium]MCW8988069.1 penicillin-binding protein 2 [Gammaproteobacteria bacterium]MCW9031094.1 penicillin-binding protein 2 [Gammaproteobacteria bacterium]
MAFNNTQTLKDHFHETQIFNQRVFIAALIMIFLLILLLSRLVYLQITNQQHYSTLSENNRVSIRPIAPTRGLIFDRNGILLAQNLPSFTLEIVPEHVHDLSKTLDILQQLISISDEDLNEFNKNLRKKRRFEGIQLRSRLSDEEVARISVQENQLPGVIIKAQLSRHYPQGSLASHAVGYVSRINETELKKLNASNYSATTHIGKVGIEHNYEHLLHGQVGFQHVETNAQGRVLRVLDRTLPVSGKNLYLNMDSKVQAIAEKSLAENNGALVAIDPRNGAVLAMASMPVYDPNLFVHGISSKNYNALSTSPERPLFNRALRGQYPPGSTIKPLMGLAGLELKELQTHDEINCPGWYMLKNDERRYRDWKKEGHKHTNLDKAITESCDVFFYDLALTLGIDNISSYLGQFGLGQQTGIDLSGELSGLNPSREWKRRTRNLPWFPGETLITGIGQGFMLTTPLQLATATAAISTMGQRFTPRMIYGIQDQQYKPIVETQSLPLPPVPINEEKNWQHVIKAMRNVVHSLHGTARGIKHNLKYTIAGKTGTAQVFGIAQDAEYKKEEIAKKLQDHALFIGYAPIENPQIAVALIVENGGSGGSVAAPIVRKVMDQYLLNLSEEKTAAVNKINSVSNITGAPAQ